MKKSNIPLLIISFLVSVSMTFSGEEGRIKQFKNGDSYTIDYILGIKNLSVLYIGKDPQFDGDEYKLLSLNMLTVPKKGLTGAYSMKGDVFTDNIKQGVKTQLKSGDKILFDDITYLKHNGEIRKCAPLMIFIK